MRKEKESWGEEKETIVVIIDVLRSNKKSVRIKNSKSTLVK